MRTIYTNQSPEQVLNPYTQFTHIRIGRVVAIYPRTGTVKVRLLNSSYTLDYHKHSDSLGQIHAYVSQPHLSWDGDKNDKKGIGNWYGTKKRWLSGVFKFPRKGDYVIVGFINGSPLSAVVLGTLPTIPITGYKALQWWENKPNGKRSNFSILDYPSEVEKYERDYGESYDRWISVHPSQVYTKIDWKRQSTDNDFQFEWSHPYGKESRYYDGNKLIISSGDDSESPIDEEEKELLTERFRWEDYEDNNHPPQSFVKFSWVDRLKPPWIKLKAIVKKSTDFFISRINSIINDYIYFMVSGDKNELKIERKNADNIHKVTIYITGEDSNIEVYRHNGGKYHYILLKDNEIYIKHENDQYIKMINNNIIIDSQPSTGDVYIKGINVYVEAQESFDTTSTPDLWLRNNVHTPDDSDTAGDTYD